VTIKKFSKKLADIYKIKTNFYYQNNKLLKDEIKINKKYKEQPLRDKCKNCNYKSEKKIFFSFGIDYFVCSKCHHLNGIYSDSKKFCHWLYEEKKTDNYNNQKFYTLKDFDKRVDNIYLPKAKFLIEVLRKNINIIDLGAGAGHFVKALEILNISCVGLEPSKYLASLGNKKLKQNTILNLSLDEIEKDFFDHHISDNKENVLSLIGVLEHLHDINSVMVKFLKSKIKYLYISVPIFSLSTFIENVFNKVYPRQLSGAHTHLYTKKSLQFFAKKYNLKIIGQWWFGQDFIDLYRSILLSSKSHDHKNYKHLLDKNLFSVIDKLQNILDKNMICSEAHIIFKKKIDSKSVFSI
jgi:2-polyprenyl-3-methyl-5-hydroxy-6-metoxy-1,4-benzoquinol methylase